MRRSRWLVVSLSTAGALSLASSGARAEGFVNLYLGGAFSEDHGATQTLTSIPDGTTFTGGGSGEFKDAVSVGGRGGYWLDSLPWLGFALDVSYFKADEDTASPTQLKLDVIPISALLMLRATLLKDSDFPRGRLQPYVGVGPAAFVTDATLDLGSLVFFPPPPALPVPGPKISDTSADPGVDVRAGVNFHFLRSWEAWAIFAEYRYTRFEPEFEDTAPRPPGPPNAAHVEIETQLNTHHVAVGVGFHF